MNFDRLELGWGRDVMTEQQAGVVGFNPSLTLTHRLTSAKPFISLGLSFFPSLIRLGQTDKSSARLG